MHINKTASKQHSKAIFKGSGSYSIGSQNICQLLHLIFLFLFALKVFHNYYKMQYKLNLNLEHDCTNKWVLVDVF